MFYNNCTQMFVSVDTQSHSSTSGRSVHIEWGGSGIGVTTVYERMHDVDFVLHVFCFNLAGHLASLLLTSIDMFALDYIEAG